MWKEEERRCQWPSKQLQGAQHHYSATELEGLAVFKSIHYFAHYLFGCRFVVLTDHKALVSFLHSRVLNRRLHGWILQLLQFDFEIQYRPGLENCDADALSRQAWDSRSGDPWQIEQTIEEKEGAGLRPAQSFVVGGDVGIDTPQKMQRMQEKDVQPEDRRLATHELCEPCGQRPRTDKL